MHIVGRIRDWIKTKHKSSVIACYSCPWPGELSFFPILASPTLLGLNVSTWAWSLIGPIFANVETTSLIKSKIFETVNFTFVPKNVFFLSKFPKLEWTVGQVVCRGNKQYFDDDQQERKGQERNILMMTSSTLRFSVWKHRTSFLNHPIDKRPVSYESFIWTLFVRKQNQLSNWENAFVAQLE